MSVTSCAKDWASAIKVLVAARALEALLSISTSARCAPRSRRRSAAAAAARLRPRPKARPSRRRKRGLAEPNCRAPTWPRHQRQGAREGLTALAISFGIILVSPGSFLELVQIGHQWVGCRIRRHRYLLVVCSFARPAFSLLGFRRIHKFFYSAATITGSARCALRENSSMRRSTSPRKSRIRPGSAMPPHRPARRSCGLRPAW